MIEKIDAFTMFTPIKYAVVGNLSSFTIIANVVTLSDYL